VSESWLLDLGCKAGGATYGYQLAGLRCAGVDKDPQPHYPGEEFRLDDAIEVLKRLAAGEELWPGAPRFAAIHASPPCQSFTAYRRRGGGVGAGYPDLIAPVRALLERTGLPWVIENVEHSPVRPLVQLCGSSFWLDVKRHRWFETPVPMMSPPCQHGIWKPRFPQATNRTNLRRTVEVGVWRIPLAVQQAAMGGMDWMTLDELTEAVPYAYTRYIGEHLLGALERAA
jgi:DNA (cytosine-5)-methyltransferase 1